LFRRRKYDDIIDVDEFVFWNSGDRRDWGNWRKQQ